MIGQVLVCGDGVHAFQKDYMAPNSHCHSDFAVSINCSYQQVAGLQPAIPQKIADCLVSIWNDPLNIIPKGEQSGQREGGWENKQQEARRRNKIMKMTCWVHPSRPLPATIAAAANRAAPPVLFWALMLWTPWVIGQLMHCSSQVVPFLAVGIHMCYTTTSRLWTLINFFNLPCSNS